MSTSAMVAGASAAASGIETVTRLQLELMKASKPGLRGQHYKQHGVVAARFEVLPDVLEEYKVGIFARPASYTAYIRFSNGSQFDDRKRDIHGMAIKLTEVEGTKILEAEATASTHDFILADNPVFFIRDTDEYVRFMVDFARTVPKGRRPFGFMFWLLFHHPLDLPVLLRFRNQLPDSPLAAQYWSQVPYAFGLGDQTICRYSVTPHPDNLAVPTLAESRDADYLKAALAGHLTVARRSARFDFNIQLNHDARPEVIDNPTVTWKGPTQRVAVITIPPQRFDSPEQLRFGENLSYTPWHALPEHRPVGQVNEIRKAVYLASSTLRHETNQTLRTEPSGIEHGSF